jgi:hypothetical protein
MFTGNVNCYCSSLLLFVICSFLFLFSSCSFVICSLCSFLFLLVRFLGLGADRRSANCCHELSTQKPSEKEYMSWVSPRIHCFFVVFLFYQRFSRVVGGKSRISRENCKISRNLDKLRENQKTQKTKKVLQTMKGMSWIIRKGIFCFFWFPHFLQILGEFSGCLKTLQT